jgi:hypothetical protein
LAGCGATSARQIRERLSAAAAAEVSGNAAPAMDHFGWTCKELLSPDGSSELIHRAAHVFPLPILNSLRTAIVHINEAVAS